MSQEEKLKYSIDIIKFVIYLITLIIGILAAYNSLDKRLSVIETEMQYKVDIGKLLEKLDMVKDRNQHKNRNRNPEKLQLLNDNINQGFYLHFLFKINISLIDFLAMVSYRENSTYFE